MYLVYSKNTLYNESIKSYIHGYLIAKTRDEALTEYKKIIGCETDDNIKLIDRVKGEEIGIYNDRYERDGLAHDYIDAGDGYIIDVENSKVTDKNLYILEYHQNGGGDSFHSYTYFEYSFSFDDILKSAINRFIIESVDSSDKAIDEMKKELLKEGYYDIPDGQIYEFGDFTLYSFDLETGLFKKL
jgi:hypothetical protein